MPTTALDQTDKLLASRIVFGIVVIWTFLSFAALPAVLFASGEELKRAGTLLQLVCIFLLFPEAVGLFSHRRTCGIALIVTSIIFGLGVWLEAKTGITYRGFMQQLAMTAVPLLSGCFAVTTDIRRWPLYLKT